MDGKERMVFSLLSNLREEELSKGVSFKVCLVLIFINTIVEKKHILNPEINLLYQFHAQKALFTVPKNCKINIWIENAPPPPLGLFQKLI